jgi:hypothetical protein
VPTTQASADAPALPRELTEFLVELSTALHKYTMYPDGHPLLETAATGIARRLKPILAERPAFSIGVARDHMLIDGMTTDRNTAVLRELAVKLYRREIGGVRIQEGVEDIELVEVMKTIAREGSKAGERNSAKIAAVKDGQENATAPLPVREWPHIHLLPLSYDQLELQDKDASTDDPERGSWANQLWTRLARSAVGPEMLGGSITVTENANDPLALAGAIERRENDPDFDKGILSMFSSFMDQIRSKGGQAAKALQSKVSSLISSLTPQTLQRILKVNTDWAQQKQLMLNASHALAADTVLDLAKAVASASAHTMSEALLLLLAKLAKHAGKGSPARRDKADAALRDNVRQLINDWDHAAELPEENYWQTLEKLIAEPAKESVSSGMHDVPGEHIVQLSLETEVFGPTTKHAVAEMVKRGQIAALLALVDGTPEENKVVRTLRRHLDNTGTIRRLLRDRPIDFEVLYRLVSRVGFPAAGALLDALELEDERGARWKLFEMLTQLGPEVGDAVVARLPKAQWFVQRNLLLLMGRLPQWPAGFSAEPYARHPDARVRREAYALLLNDEKLRDKAVADAVGDEDERIVRAGLNVAAERGCPRDAMPVLTKRLAAHSLEGMLGVLAVKVLQPVRLQEVLECFVAATLAPKRRFQFRRKLAPKTPVTVAALAALATTWRQEPAAQKVLAIAARDNDPEIQAALRGTRSA